MGHSRKRSVMNPQGGTPAVPLCGLLVAALALAGCHSSAPDVSFDAPPSFDFRNEDPHWSAGFADVPVGYEDSVQFVADHRPLPPPLTGNGLYQSGMNFSDDLCMWFAHGVSGFEPGAEYALSFEVGIASDAGADCTGIASSTYVKVGAASYPPSRSEVLGWWRMNVDKGMASGDGTQALTIGDIRNANGGCTTVNAPWGERRLSSSGREVRVRASSDGTIWLFVLTDSGWEGAYRVYFTHLDVNIRRV